LNDDDDDRYIEDDDDYNEDDDDHNKDDDDYIEDDDDSEQVVNFDASKTSYGGDIPNRNIDQSFAWILYWIFKYQERYQLSDTATNSLVKFIRYLLILHDKNTYSSFPKSLYKARKSFGVSDDQIIKYATCQKCCKLYSIKDLSTDQPHRCSFRNFPNHPRPKLRSPCNADITKEVPTDKGIVYKPMVVYPIIDLKLQLQ